ncbi:MAG: YkgJ family cysteine cluster protein [Planctomycetota bacterium]|jgi:Fe-S-cluster containining protein
MRLQVLDESVKFSCGSCTACCDQPWRTSIEADKAHALSQHDWSTYPQLENISFYHASTDGREGFYELAKGEGTKCLFLDTDGSCIIHKEMGAEAKPNMCRQFPFFPAQTWTEDRISANYGCPAVQNQNGTLLTEQQSEVAELVPRTNLPANPDGPIMLDTRTRLTQTEGNALFDRAMAIFGENTDADLWIRFTELLVLLAAVKELKSQNPDDPQGLIDRLNPQNQWLDTLVLDPIHAYASPTDVPMPARFLFAATLSPDTLPADAKTQKGFFSRLTRIPKLMALASMSGVYPSRVLGRNVCFSEVMQHQLAEQLPPSATQLLLRYYRSRIWQRFPASTRMTVAAGIHQHIQDLNAIIFFARADAQHQNESQLTESLIRKALTHVEFHLANQTRLYELTLKGWIMSQLNNPALALHSLRLMALRCSDSIPAAQDALQQPSGT